MNPAALVHGLWEQKEYLQALTQVWDLGPAAHVRYSSIRKESIGLTLRNIVFKACHSAVAELGGRRGDRDKAISWVNDLLDRPIPTCLVSHRDGQLNLQWCKDYRKRMILAHLLCARAALGPEMSATGLPYAALEKINTELVTRGVEPLSLAFVNELSKRLALGPRHTLRATPVWFPLASYDGRQENAVLAKFVLEPLHGGTGEAFVAVEQAFVPMDRDFARVFHDAPQLLKQHGLCSPSTDVRVSIERTEELALIETPLLGNSSGGALALGLWSVWTGKLLEDGLVTSFSLRHSCESEPDGLCHPICFETVKLNAIARVASMSQRRLTFLVAESQFSTFPDMSAVDVKPAAKVQSAIELVEANRDSAPSVTIFPTEEPDLPELFEESLRLYAKEFSDHRLRVDPGDLRCWLKDTEFAEIKGDPWRELWAVLHECGEVGGFANVSVHVDRPWCLGGYLAVRKDWRTRSPHWGKQLMDAIRNHVRQLAPSVKGVILEVEPFDLEQLKNAAKRGTVKGETDEADIVKNYNHLRRIWYFQRLGAWVVMGNNGFPLMYRQPSLEDSSCYENGYELVLMLLPFDPGKPEVSLPAMFDFIYDDVYGGSYNEPGETHIEGYAEPLQDLKQEQLQQCAAGFDLDRISRRSLPPEVVTLEGILRRERLIHGEVY